MSSLFKEQPPAFQMIFLLEVWERFGYYVTQGILTLYFIRFLGYSETRAYYTFGAFFALVYAMVALGGYLGDKVLGTKRTLILGLITLAAGYFALALSSKTTVFAALGLICVGNGLFKANPANLLASCYEKEDPRLHGAFTLYYMAVNLGSSVSLILGPYLSSRYGYFYAYLASGIGLLLGLLNYRLQRHLVAGINNAAERRLISLWQWWVIVLCIAALTGLCTYLLEHLMIAQLLLWLMIGGLICVYFYYFSYEDKKERQRMMVALVLMIEGVIFFILYQQMPTSLTLFAVNNVIPHLLGIPIDPQSFQVLNPLWIIIMGPLLAMFYRQLYQRGVFFPTPYKFATGMILAGFSFVILFFARFWPNEQGMVSSWWLVASYLFQSTGELLVSALGVAMAAELVPVSIRGFVMGMWFMMPSVAGFIGAQVASYTSLPANIEAGFSSLVIYTQVFLWIGLITVGVGGILWLLAAPLQRFSEK